MPTSARIVDEITGESIWLERDEGDPNYCVGPVITSSIDLGFPAARPVLNNIPDANGATDISAFHSSRTVTWNGWITPTPSDPFPAQTWDKLRKLCAPNRRPQLFIAEDGWGGERRMVVRGDSVTSPLDRALGPVIVAAMSWVCPSGVLESAVANANRIQLSGGTGGLCVSSGGICFTGGCGSFFTPGNFGGATIVQNLGTVVTYPVITFTGPCKNPRVIDVQTQQGIFLNCTLVANQTIVVNCLAKSVTEIASPNINRLGYYDYTRSTWQTLPVGGNPYQYVSDDKNGTCQFTWRNRWI